MKSFFIADILGEDLPREKAEERKPQWIRHESTPDTKPRGDRKCDRSIESNCLPSWRRKFTDGQTNDLEELFLRQKYITGKERLEIANRLGLSTKQVKTWFQNRRTKWKREKQRNVYLGDCCRQDGYYALAENFNRTVEDYAQHYEITDLIPVNSWGCCSMGSAYPVSVIDTDNRHL